MLWSWGEMCDRERPVETVLDRGRVRTVERFRPDVDGVDVAGPVIDPLEVGVVASAPDDVRVDRVGDDEAAFAAGRRLPERARRGAQPLPGRRRARALIGVAVLHAAVDVIGNLVVHRDMVHLGDRQVDPPPGLAPVERDRAPPSSLIMNRSGFVGSAHMSWVVAAPGDDLGVVRRRRASG